MTDARTPAPHQSGLVAFLGEALKTIAKPGIFLAGLMLLIVLTVSNIVILQNIPAEGERPSAPVVAAALVRVVGLIALSVPILRVAASSERPAYRPDAAFFLYALVSLISLVVMAAAVRAFGADMDVGSIAIRTTVLTLIIAPLTVWFVGAAVAVPLGWQPTRFIRDFGRWLPHVLVWSLVLIVPMSVLHAVIDIGLLEGRIAWFWPAAIFDGVLSTAMVLVAYGLYVAAYRRVARS